MNDRTIEARAPDATGGSRRHRQAEPTDIPSLDQIASVAGRADAVRRNLRATLAITDKVTDLIEVTGNFQKITR